MTGAIRSWPRGWQRLLALLLLLATPLSALEAEPAIWSLQGGRGEVLLLGSVHLLRSEDYPLPANVTRAYGQADRLVMELDIDDLDPLQSQMLLMEKGRLPEGRTLAQTMGASDYRRAQKYAEALGMPLDLLGSLKPWLAALTVMNLHTMSLGYSPELGLEQHLTSLAVRDGKDVAGLETMRFQLELFDEMPERVQNRLLLQTLEEASMMDKQLGTLIAAWRKGDSATLERELGRSFEDYPDVYRRLVSDRNRSWVEPMLRMSDEAGTTLVIVGALHLVGKDSVIEMLKRKGREVERWDSAR